MSQEKPLLPLEVSRDARMVPLEQLEVRIPRRAPHPPPRLGIFKELLPQARGSRDVPGPAFPGWQPGRGAERRYPCRWHPRISAGPAGMLPGPCAAPGTNPQRDPAGPDIPRVPGILDPVQVTAWSFPGGRIKPGLGPSPDPSSRWDFPGDLNPFLGRVCVPGDIQGSRSAFPLKGEELNHIKRVYWELTPL